jgi:hypothetical protein
MKRWVRAIGDTWCGSCSDVIREKDPMLVIETGDGRKFRRCRSCAGEPPDVEQLEREDIQREATTSTRRRRSFRADGNQARDFKRAAGGDE